MLDRCDVAVVSAYPLDTDPIQMGKSINLAKKLSARATVVVNSATDGIFYHGMGMGSGVHAPRLLRNLPRLLTSPHEQWAWLRGFTRALGVGSPLLAARLSYFTLNYLSYSGFAATDFSSDTGVTRAGAGAAAAAVGGGVSVGATVAGGAGGASDAGPGLAAGAAVAEGATGRRAGVSSSFSPRKSSPVVPMYLRFAFDISAPS